MSDASTNPNSTFKGSRKRKRRAAFPDLFQMVVQDPVPDVKRFRRRRMAKRRNVSSRPTPYAQYFLEFWMKVIRISLSFNFVHSFMSGSKWAAWAQVSKGEILLRLPSMCKKSVDYYRLRLRTSRTASFLLKIKRFNPGKPK